MSGTASGTYCTGSHRCSVDPLGRACPRPSQDVYQRLCRERRLRTARQDQPHRRRRVIKVASIHHADPTSFPGASPVQLSDAIPTRHRHNPSTSPQGARYHYNRPVSHPSSWRVHEICNTRCTAATTGHVNVCAGCACVPLRVVPPTMRSWMCDISTPTGSIKPVSVSATATRAATPGRHTRLRVKPSAKSPAELRGKTTQCCAPRCRHSHVCIWSSSRFSM